VTRSTKNISLLALSGVLVAVVLLGGSLSGLELNTGAPVPGAGGQVNLPQSPGSTSPVPAASIPVLQGFLALIFLFLFLNFSFRLLLLANRKLILRAAVFSALALLLLVILPRTPVGQSGMIPVDDSAAVSSTSPSYRVTALGQPPQFLQWIVAGCAGLGLAILAYRALRSDPAPQGAENAVLEEAVLAVQALKAGEAPKNVILRCYLEMSQSLQENRGIKRDQVMTTGEFEHLLGVRGFPPAPVHQLTDLFEKARYGELPMSDVDEVRAIESLNEIIDFCRGE